MGDDKELVLKIKEKSTISYIASYLSNNILVVAFSLIAIADLIFFIFSIFGFIFFKFYVMGVEVTPMVLSMLLLQCGGFILPVYIIYYVITLVLIRRNDNES